MSTSESSADLTLSDLLKELKLDKYRDSLEENGCESIDDLLDTTEEELNELCKESNIPTLKAKKLKKRVNQLRPNTDSNFGFETMGMNWSDFPKTFNKISTSIIQNMSQNPGYHQEYHTSSKTVSSSTGGSQWSTSGTQFLTGSNRFSTDRNQVSTGKNQFSTRTSPLSTGTRQLSTNRSQLPVSTDTNQVSKVSTGRSQLCPRCDGKGKFGDLGWSHTGKKGTCALCNGNCEVHGTFHKCWKCDGKGLLSHNTSKPQNPWQGVRSSLRDCHVCNGKGYKQSKGYECPQCEGHGYYNSIGWVEKNKPKKGSCLLCQGTEVKHQNYSKCRKCKGNGFFAEINNKPYPIWTSGKLRKCSLCRGCGWR